MNQEELANRVQALLDRVAIAISEGKVVDEKPAYPYFDIDNGQRLAAILKGTFRYDEAHKVYLEWNGQKWSQTTGGYAMRRIPEAIESINDEAQVWTIATAKLAEAHSVNLAHMVDKDYLPKTVAEKNIKHLHKLTHDAIEWAEKSRGGGHARYMVTHALVQEDVADNIQNYDTKGNFCGVKNGVIKLKKDGSVEFIKENPDYKITKQLGANYDPEATCDRWKVDIKAYACGDEGLERLLQKIAGYALLGTRRNKLFFLTGGGGNGKSTFVDTLKILCADYAIAVDAKKWLTNDQKGEYYKATAKGTRLMIMNETEKTFYTAAELIKQTVDSGEISARHPGGRPFDYQPVFLQLVCMNRLPEIQVDEAIKRRLMIVPFNYEIPADKRNPTYVDDVLRPELDGILNWCIEGYKMWVEEKFDNEPKAVLQATAEYFASQDVLRNYLADCGYIVTGDMADSVPFSELYDKYELWCGKNGKKGVMNKKNFGLELDGKDVDGLKVLKGVDNHNSRVFKGLKYDREQDQMDNLELLFRRRVAGGR